MERDEIEKDKIDWDMTIYFICIVGMIISIIIKLLFIGFN